MTATEKAADNRIRCAYCDYSVARFWSGKNGRIRSGQAKLFNHVAHAHFSEFLDVLQKNGLNPDDYL